MKYVLDTNIVSALMRGDIRVADRLAAEAPENVSFTQPTLSEVSCGITRLPDSKRKRKLQARLTEVEANLQRAVWTDQVSQTFGRIKSTLERRGQPLEDFDIAIAAHALNEGATLVTTDRHMRRIPNLIVEDWSE